jgi:HlyD family secretion protein
MRRAGLVVFALLTLGCGHKSALDRPGWHQGVIEHDDRDLCFEIAGTVSAVAVARGAAVEKDQELARLDDSLEQAAVTQREADARTAEARLALLRAGTRAQDLAIARAQAQAAAADAEVAAADFERQRAVAAQDALAKAQLDQARQRAVDAEAQHLAADQRLSAAVEGARPEELAEAKAALDSAQAALALERQRLAKHRIQAPIPGRVVEIALDPGEAALPGRAILTVADTKHPYIDAYVPEKALPGLALGGKAQVRADGDEHAYAGVIEVIGRQLEYTPRFLFSPADRPNLMMRVRVRIDDPEERLHAGVPAAVRFGDLP